MESFPKCQAYYRGGMWTSFVYLCLTDCQNSADHGMFLNLSYAQSQSANVVYQELSFYYL